MLLFLLSKLIWIKSEDEMILFNRLSMFLKGVLNACKSIGKIALTTGLLSSGFVLNDLSTGSVPFEMQPCLREM